MCLVSPVKLKYILSEGRKLLRLVEGLEEWTQSSCYITSTEDGQPELKDLGVWQCDGARHTSLHGNWKVTASYNQWQK